MNRLIVVLLTVMAVALAGMAWQFVVQFEPASPVIPFALMFTSGIVFRQAIGD